MRIFLGVTGASGALYGAHALRALTAAGCDVGLCVSPAGCQVIAHEILGLGPRPSMDAQEIVARFVERFTDGAGLVEPLDHRDIAAPYASGSARVPAALVAPCSMGTLGRIAHGTGDNLIHRACEVMLKERRRLVLIPRETPLSAIHLDNMLTATRAGAVVLPAMPGLYTLPASVEDMIDFVVGKALDLLDVPHTLLRRWDGVEVPA
jgi:4-hydroxy-3-polyprenylbenzoate decarboxylase